MPGSGGRSRGSEANIVALANYMRDKKQDTVTIPQSKWRNWAAGYLTENDVMGIKTALNRRVGHFNGGV
jgi:hypothetical protein